MLKSQTVKTTNNSFSSNINRGISTGLGSGNRTIIATRTQGTGGVQPGLRRSSRGSRVWKKTILGKKFEYAEKLKEKKNYILYVSGMGHERRQIEEIEEMVAKPEPPKEKVVEVREIIDNYEYHETKNVKKKDPRRTSITHHERLSTPFERTTLKKYSSHTSAPKSIGFISNSVNKKRIITDLGVQNPINLNKYNSFTTKQQTIKAMVPSKLYETYKPTQTQYTKTTRTTITENKAQNTISQPRNQTIPQSQITKTTRTITTQNKAPNPISQPRNQTITQSQITKTTRTIITQNKAPSTILQPRNKIIPQPQIIKTKTEISKISNIRQNDNRPKYQPKIDNKYKRPFNDGNNETKTETTQDGEYVVKVTTIKTQIGKYGKPQEIPRGGSAPRPGQRPRNEVLQNIRNSGPKQDFERPKPKEFGVPHFGPHGPYIPHGFSGPNESGAPHMPPSRMPRFERPKTEERDKKPKSLERPKSSERPHIPFEPRGPMPHGPSRNYGTVQPHGFLGPHGPQPHGPVQPHGFLGPHGPMAHGPHYGPHGFLGPHHPDFEGKHIESGFAYHHGSRGTIESDKIKPYQVNIEPRRRVENKPKPEERTLPVRRESPKYRPRGFIPPHGPLGPHNEPHGFMPHHAPVGPHQEPHGIMPHHAPLGPHYQPHGFMPHLGPLGPHNEPHGLISPHGPLGSHYQPHGLISPHAPVGSHYQPHGFISPHGPHQEPQGFKREEYGKQRALTTENEKRNINERNITGMSQYRFQQTTSKSNKGDNYEYFESKYVVKSGRVNQPITVHHRRGGKGDDDNQLSKSVNRSSSYNKPSSQIQTRNNISTGTNITKTQFTQKTTNIRVKEGNNEGKGIFTEYKKYTQKGTGLTSAINTSKYGANTVNTTKYGSGAANKTQSRAGAINKSQYGSNTYNSGASSINKSKYVTGSINISKNTNILSKNEASSNKSKYGSGNVNVSKYNAGSTNMSKYGAGSYNKINSEMNRNINISSRQEKHNSIKRNEDNDVLCQTFDESEFGIIFCPVHGKQYVKKKKVRKFN